MLLAIGSAEWLTGFWLLSVGVALGLILLLALLAVFIVGSRLGLAKVADSKKLNTIVGSVLSLVFIGIGAYIWFSMSGTSADGQTVNSSPFLAFLLLVPTGLFLGFGAIGICSSRSQEQLNEWLTEGISFWLLTIASGLSVFALIGIAGQQVPTIRFVTQPNAILQSVFRLPSTGVQAERKIEINPSLEGDQGLPVNVNFYGSELKRFTFQSDQRLEFATQPITVDLDPQKILELPASSEPTTYNGSSREGAIPKGFVEKLYIRNMGDRPTQLSLILETQPEFPQVRSVFVAMICTLASFVVILFQSVLLPKESAISWATFKTETNQPLFAILIAVGGVFLAAAVYIPYNTFGEDIKMYVTTGCPVILLLSIFFAVWASSKSVSEEIDGRTALTVLAKPISRRQFLVGKSLGIGWTVGIMFLCLGLWFLFLVSYKPIYDGVESSKGALPWQDGFAEMAKVIPALVLGYMETMVFVCISVMISTRLPIVSNLMICFAIYIMGHITPLLLEKEDSFQGVAVVGQTISTVIPVLEHFDVRAAIVGEVGVPMEYLGWTLVYCVLYCSVALLVALILFEDRDLS